MEVLSGCSSQQRSSSSSGNTNSTNQPSSLQLVEVAAKQKQAKNFNEKGGWLSLFYHASFKTIFYLFLEFFWFRIWATSFSNLCLLVWFFSFIIIRITLSLLFLQTRYKVWSSSFNLLFPNNRFTSWRYILVSLNDLFYFKLLVFYGTLKTITIKTFLN